MKKNRLLNCNNNKLFFKLKKKKKIILKFFFYLKLIKFLFLHFYFL